MKDKKSSSSEDKKENIILPVWEMLFDNKEQKENLMVLDKLLNKKIKVWSVLANTVNGVRGTIKGQVGVLTSLDNEFIVLDGQYYLSRKFIYRIEEV